MKKHVASLVEVAGAVGVTAGFGMFSAALGAIVAGVFLMAAANARGGRR